MKNFVLITSLIASLMACKPSLEMDSALNHKALEEGIIALEGDTGKARCNVEDYNFMLFETSQTQRTCIFPLDDFYVKIFCRTQDWNTRCSVRYPIRINEYAKLPETL